MIGSNKIKYVILAILFLLLINLLLWQNLILNVVAAILAIYIGIKQFYWDKKELALADLYVRTERSPHEETFVLIGLCIWLGGFVYFFNSISVELQNRLMVPFVIIGVVHILDSFHSGFTNSIRAFSHGIKFPNDRERLIR